MKMEEQRAREAFSWLVAEKWAEASDSQKEGSSAASWRVEVCLTKSIQDFKNCRTLIGKRSRRQLGAKGELHDVFSNIKLVIC